MTSAIRNRSGDPYKAAVVATYRSDLESNVYPALGSLQLTELTRKDAQRMVERMQANGARASTVRNALIPLRVIVRLAIQRGLLLHNPLEQLALPAPRGRRERFASAHDALALIDAAPAQDRCLWAVFFFAGLRLSEARALRPPNVDLGAGVIRVRYAWTRYAAEPEQAKTHAGARDVPIVRQLAEHLRAHLESGHSELLFATMSGRPIDGADVRDRARRAWADAKLDANYAARGAPYLRQSDGRSRRADRGSLPLHGPLNDLNHRRPLPPPLPRSSHNREHPPRRTARSRRLGQPHPSATAPSRPICSLRDCQIVCVSSVVRVLWRPGFGRRNGRGVYSGFASSRRRGR